MKYHVASSVSLYDFLRNNNIPSAQNSIYIHISDVNGASRRKLYIRCFLGKLFGNILLKVKSRVEP